MGVCGAERSQVLVKFLVRTASRGELLFRSSGPDYIETSLTSSLSVLSVVLFRSSGPDYIETSLVKCIRELLVGRIVPVFRTGLH